MYPSLSKKGELYKWTPFFSTKRKVLSEIVKFPPVNPNFKTIRFGNGNIEEGSVIESAYRSIYDALREIAKILDLDEENTAASRLENKAEFLAIRRDGSDISATKDQRVAQLTSLLAKVLAMRNTQITDYQVTIAKAINNILRIHGDKDYSVYSEGALDDMAMDRALGFVQEDGGKATDITNHQTLRRKRREKLFLACLISMG